MKTLTFLPSSFSSSYLLFLLVLSLCSICFCNKNSDRVPCIPTERLALIDLKSNLTDESNRLSSWVGKDCCSWSGVVCDNITSHVHEIHLRGPDNGIPGLFSNLTHDELFSDQFPVWYATASKQMLGGTISSSVIKLLQLRHLDLSCNDFGNSLIPGFIGSFQNLIYLNFSYSNFSGEIPHQLGNISTLCVLDLHNIEFFGTLYSKSLAWVKNLIALRHLDMSEIYLAEALDWFPAISNLTSLQEIHFSSCSLPRIPSNPTTVGFTSLVVLDLFDNTFNSMLPGWIFNLSNLVSLDLFNGLFSANPVNNGGFHSMPLLRTLRVPSNPFVNTPSILNGLSRLSSLRLLDVGSCGISSPILGSLQNLSLIEHVDLSYNEIVEEIPRSLSNLCSITTLQLQYNKFYGNVSELLDRFCECELPKLELLSLRDNHLFGQLPERLGNLKNLIQIRLGGNNLTGTIPYSIGSLSLLEELGLRYNKLNGSLPESIGRLSKLKSLYLDNNSLTGVLTENNFANLMSLKTLSVGDNKLVFKLNVNSWIPPFKLQRFTSRSCNLGPQFPSWIQSQTDLEHVDISNASISDTIPNWLWTTFSSIQYLNISHNNIQGKLGDVTFFGPGASLDLSNNHLHGMLHGNFSRADLSFLDLSNNNVSGSLEQFLLCSGIQESRALQLLNLANNNMSGVIPDCWMNFQSLAILNLEKNQFSGIIPSSLGNISSLLSLEMDANKLSGNLPHWLLNSSSLIVIELAENKLMGKIPSSIGRNNTSLRVLSLRSNKFEGKIPDEICHLISLQILDLAHNDMSGNLPACFINLSVMSGRETSEPIVLTYDWSYTSSYEATASLVTKGNTYTYSTILYQVTSLDLSDNKFSGSIPDEVVGLLGLRFLNLSHNNLTGRIPNLFNQIGMLESLDLSKNHLNGSIPLSLAQLTALSWLNVSYNNLVGRIPIGPQLQTFSESSYTGNALCGDPLPACSPNNGDAKGITDQHDESNGTDWILVILTLVGMVVGFWIVFTPLLVSRQWRIAYYRFLEEIWFKLKNFLFLLFHSLTKRCRSNI